MWLKEMLEEVQLCDDKIQQPIQSWLKQGWDLNRGTEKVNQAWDEKSVFLP